LACWFWRRRFLEFFSVFLICCYYLPLERGNPLYLNKFGIIPSKDDLCQVSLKLAQWFWRRFLNHPIPYFCDYLPFEEDLALNLYHVWLNLACWFWRRFLKISSVFLIFRYYLPLEKGYPLRLNNLKSPTPKDDLCQVWLIIGPVVLEKRIFKWPHPIFSFLWLSPLWREPGPLFE
jgi:hypothetical protein